MNRAWIAQPDPVRARWWRVIGLGMVAVLAFTGLLVWFTRALQAAGLLTWETAAVRWIAAEIPISFSTAMWLEGVGNGFVLWGLVLYAATMSARAGRPRQTLAFLLGYTMVYLPIAAGWWLWARPRPRLVLDGLALPGGPFHAFPSGHMVQSVFAFGLLLWLWLRATPVWTERAAGAILYLLLVSIIAIGRLRIGVHWPSDIAGGALIGGAWLAFVVTAASGESSESGADGR